MSSPVDETVESDCLCQKFVPEEKRIDFQHIAKDEKTGKRRWATYLRYHQDCPFHGVLCEEIK